MFRPFLHFFYGTFFSLATFTGPVLGQNGFLDKPLSFWQQQLGDTRPQVRRGAVFALGKSGDPEALNQLVGALEDADPGVRDAAAYALGELAFGQHAGAVWARAGSRLQVLLGKDPDRRVRRSAAYAAGSCGAEAADARSSLVTALRDQEAMVRQNAAWALGRLGPEVGDTELTSLAHTLQDQDAVVRRDAAVALGELGRPAARVALPALLGCCRKETESPVRKAALDSLRKLVTTEDKKLAPDLVRLLEQPQREVARAAALALGKIGGREARPAVPILKTALHDEDPAVRELAAGALANIGEAAASAVSNLSEALADSSAAVRCNAALALAHIGSKAETAVRPLARALDLKEPTEVRLYAAEALGKVGPAIEQVIEDLLRALKEEDDQRVRQRIVFALHQVRSSSPTRAVVAALEAVLEETSPRSSLVRYDAARVLAFWLGGEASPKVLKTLVAMLRDPGLRLYTGSVSVLQAGDEKTVGSTTVKENLAGDARFLAAEALEQIGPKANRPEVIEALEAAAGSQDLNTSRAARAALNRIRERSR
jgi:HEAT repeat protein